jgi:Tol biopolymer transport system component
MRSGTVSYFRAFLCVCIFSSVLSVVGVAPPAAGATSSGNDLPLNPERAVEFTTDEGTWMSVDVSPDGKKIIFDMLGQLYTIPVGGGEAKPIISGLDFNSQPRFSPDGQHIAFISDRSGAENLWLADVDGSNARQLSKEEESEFSSPAWLADGQLILVSRQSAFPSRPFELWAYHIDGGAGLVVVKYADKPDAPAAQWRNTIGAVASPDGKYLYYARRGTTAGGAFYNLTNFPLSEIVRRDRVTGDEDTITAAPGSAFRPVLSPDGLHLVYGTRYETETGLKILDLQTGDERWLKYPVQRDDQESVFTQDFLPGYAFTPDGKDIVVSYGGKIHRVDVATGRDRLIPFTAKVSRGIGPLLDFPSRVDTGPVKWRIIQGATQSPDGKQLVFSAGTHLYTMAIPSGTPRRLTKSTEREFQPIWSPDGRWIAYVSWSKDGGHIWKTRSDGSSSPTRLTQTPASYRSLAWTPDGGRIVGLRGPRQWQLAKTRENPGEEEEMLNLVWIPADGGAVHVIAPAHGGRNPHFVTEQTDRIYVYTPQGLVSMRWDGSDRRTHLKISRVIWESFEHDHVHTFDEARISPDGRWVAILNSQQLYLTPAPSFGGEPVTIDLTGVTTPSRNGPGAGEAGGGSPKSGSAILPVKKVTRIGADSFAWAANGSALAWTVGPSFLRQSFAELSSGRGRPEEIAVNLEFPRSTPVGTALLRGAKVITMRGNEVIDDADILVKNNRIAKVGQRDSFNVPADAKVFELSGSTIVPGFIDLHPHYSEIRRRGVLDLDDNWDFFTNLAYGVTTGRDPQSVTPDLFAYQDLVDMGELPGPRAFSTGPGIFPLNDFRSFDELEGVVSRYQKYYRTKWVKSYLVGNRRQREWMIQACKELQMMPTTEGGEDFKLNLTHMLDGFSGNEHALPITPLYKDVVQLMAQSKITYTPTLIVAFGGPWGESYFYENSDIHGDPKVRYFIPHGVVDERTKRRPDWFSSDEHAFPRLAAQAKKMVEAGGRVGVGSHGQFQGLGYHWEMWMLASGGLSNFEVLKSATLHGAEAMGYAQDLGSIEQGKLADLVILAKNPLEDIHNTNTIRYVMKNGELFDGNTLNELWPVRKSLPRSWASEEPPADSSASK